MILFSFCLFDFLSISTTYGHRSGLKRRPVNWELCLTAQLSLKHNGLGQYPHHCSHCTSSSVHLQYRSIFFPTVEQDPDILKLLHLAQGLLPDQKWTLHHFLAENDDVQEMIFIPAPSQTQFQFELRLFQNLTKRIETAFYSHILLSVHTMKCFLYACCLISFQGKYVYHTGSPGGRFWRLIDCTLSKPQLNPTMWPRVC